MAFFLARFIYLFIFFRNQGKASGTSGGGGERRDDRERH